MALSESVPHMRIAALIAALVALQVATGTAQAQSPVTSPSLPAHPRPEPRPDPLELAQSGDVSAQYRLAKAYLTGTGLAGIKRNIAEGLSWLALAAVGGSTQAALDLAQSYERGLGVEASEVEAARWWLQAGRLGDETARERFLEMLMAGQIDRLMAPDAARWLEAKADQGDIQSMLGLGRLYELGRGVPAEHARAERWYLEAARLGDSEAQFRLGRLYLKQAGAWQVPVKDGFERFAFKLSPRQARDEGIDGDKLTYIRPGMLKAEYWLGVAARRGHAEAQYLLGISKVQGIDLPFDAARGFGWLQAAAERNHLGALAALAGLAERGHGLPEKDPVRAWANYDLAAHLGRKDAGQARDSLAKTLTPRQLSRARAIAQDLREFRGM